MRGVWLVVLTGALVAGCATYTPIASHTVATGPDQQADVVWLIDDSGSDPVVVRCSPTPEGPVCQPARAAQPKGE